MTYLLILTIQFWKKLCTIIRFKKIKKDNENKKYKTLLEQKLLKKKRLINFIKYVMMCITAKVYKIKVK